VFWQEGISKAISSSGLASSFGVLISIRPRVGLVITGAMGLESEFTLLSSLTSGLGRNANKFGRPIANRGNTRQGFFVGSTKTALSDLAPYKFPRLKPIASPVDSNGTLP
jgi:hypothetical protein